MQVSFAKDKWKAEDFQQITSLRTDGRQPFIQEETCVVNDLVQKEHHMEHNYISLLSKEWFDAPVTLQTVCSFEKFGAPLIVFSDDVIAAEDGYPAYGHHFETVVFEEGINVWELNGKDKPILAGKGRFPVPAKEQIHLSIQVLEGRMIVNCMGQETVVECSTLPVHFRAGITACEGVNRFYSFSAE